MLTLIVVPVVYTYFDGLGGWFKRRFVSEKREHELAEEQAAAGFEPHGMTGD
jgi:hypothetical protein